MILEDYKEVVIFSPKMEKYYHIFFICLSIGTIITCSIYDFSTTNIFSTLFAILFLNHGHEILSFVSLIGLSQGRKFLKHSWEFKSSWIYIALGVTLLFVSFKLTEISSHSNSKLVEIPRFIFFIFLFF